MTDQLARQAAEDLAKTLDLAIEDEPSYTFDDTGQAAAWPIVGNPHGARITVNVEQPDQPYALIETGSLDAPEYHQRYEREASLGWVEYELGWSSGPKLVNALGAGHPILHGSHA